MFSLETKRILTIQIALVLELGLASTTNEVSGQHLIGIHPDRQTLYQPTSDNYFDCLDRSRRVPFSAVNDNYCDCIDGTDEPGTSACPNGRFFCHNLGYVHRIIPSGWVNDNQCDCCDASDEYNSTIQCENNCGVLGELYRREQEKNRLISDQGSAIRSQYKEQARLKREQNSQLLEQYKREVSEKENAIKKLEEDLNADFGPNQVFLPLKGKCFNFNDREYVYTLCPFERATQESTAGMQTELGRWAGWAGSSENPYSMQKYEGGAQCWNGPARSAVITIACGVEDKIVSVSEPAKCEYVYDFISPAACPDLDPPEQAIDTQPTQEETTPSSYESALETEEERVDGESNYFPDEHNEAPDDDSNNHEKHDEL